MAELYLEVPFSSPDNGEFARSYNSNPIHFLVLEMSAFELENFDVQAFHNRNPSDVSATT